MGPIGSKVPRPEQPPLSIDLAADGPKVAAPNRRGRAEEMILHEVEQRLIAIVRVDVPMRVADAYMIQPQNLLLRQRPDFNVRPKGFRLPVSTVNIVALVMHCLE